MKELVEKLKKKEESLKDSIIRLRGLLEMDKEKVETDKQLLIEFRGRLSEVQQLKKEMEEKKVNVV